MSTKALKSKPLCAVCGTPVQSFTEEDDGDRYVTFEARCHGRTQRIRVWSEHTVTSLGFAFADEPRRLEAPTG